MAYLVVAIIDDIDDCHPVMDAWEEAGAGGVTILESSGIGRIRQSQIRDDFPILPSLHEILRNKERHHRTLFSVVETEEEVQALVKAARSVLGDFNQPDTGFLFVIALHQVFGLETPKRDLRDTL